MLKLLKVYLKIHEFTTENIESSLIGQEFWLIYFGLKYGDFKTRKQILTTLTHHTITKPFLIRRLLFIVKEDFLENSELALRVLENTTIKNAAVQHKLINAKEIYLDKVRREDNLIRFHQNFISPIKGKMFDKSKMERLAIVREQVKDGIRMH